MNALSITSCKRLNHFEKTISSFHKHCKDINKIDLVLWYDDNSNDDDRTKMLKILSSYFGDKKIISTFFSKNSFSTKKRHMEIMNLWKKDLSLLSLDYVFHTEDEKDRVGSFLLLQRMDQKNHFRYQMYF